MTTLHLCTTCPNLVPDEAFDSSDGVGRCLQCVADGKTVSWPGVWVGSEEFQSRPVQERLVELARGYLKSAMTLCEELGEHRDRLDWPRASVVYFLIHHAAELFLKGCILLRAPAGEKLHHDVSKLQDRYCELFPELKDAFHIETPWDVGLERAEEVFGVTLNVEGFEYNPDQVYRYMTGKNGATATAIHRFTPGTCLLLCQRLEGEFGRVWDAVNGRTGTA